MPAPDRPDMFRSYRIAGKLREIALGTNEHPAEDPDLIHAADVGHVEHDGEAWSLTGQGDAVLAQVIGQPAASQPDTERGLE